MRSFAEMKTKTVKLIQGRLSVTSKTKLFTTTVNNHKSFTTVVRNSVLDVGCRSSSEATTLKRDKLKVLKGSKVCDKKKLQSKYQY